MASYGYQQNEMSPYERMIYQDDPMVMSALGNYANYRGASLPSSNIAMPKLPSGNISLGALPSANISLGSLPSAQSNINPDEYKVDTKELKNAASDVTNFRIEANDPVYAWKQREAKKAALSALSAKGLSGSKYGMSTLSNAQMNVMSDEAEQQFNRKLAGYSTERDVYGVDYQTQSDLYGRRYAKETDEYNRGFQNKMAQYQVKSDNYSRGYQNTMARYQAASDNYNRSFQGAMAKYQVASDNYNRAFQNASYTDNMNMQQLANTYNMASQVSNTRYGRMLDAIQIGAGAAAAAGNNAMTAGANIGNAYGAQGNAMAQGYYGAGQANAQWANAMGNAPANALKIYYGAQ
jgi:hypothetical protein